MKYIVRIDRPKIDDQIIDMEYDSKEEAAVAVVGMLELCRLFEEDFSVLNMEQTETHLTVYTSTGTIKAFPNPQGLN